MKKTYRPILVAIAAACLLGAFVPVASAYPSKTTRCGTDGCHAAGAGATVNASLVSTSATTATYNLAMTGSENSAWAVFDGSTRLFSGKTATGAFTVELGKTYDLMAVDATSSNLATKSVSPAAPSIEPTAPPVSLDESTPPVTTSNALGSYPGAAQVKLTATDGSGQGVAYIYYSLDGNRVHLFTVGLSAQTTVDIAAPAAGKTATHTISFWSQDKAGNVEAVKSATFTVAGAALPPVVTPPVAKTHVKLTTPAAPSTVYARRWFKVTGYMTRHASGSHPVQLRFYRYTNGSYVYFKTLSPAVYNSMFSEYSQYSVETALQYEGMWRVRSVHTSDSLHLTTYSNYEYLRVAPVVKTRAKLTKPSAPSTVHLRRSFKVSGYMTRHTSGSHAVKLRFYRYKSGHYVYYKTLRPAVYNSMFSEYSKYSVKTTLKYKGKWRIRSVHGDSLHLTSYSKYEYLRVE